MMKRNAAILALAMGAFFLLRRDSDFENPFEYLDDSQWWLMDTADVPIYAAPFDVRLRAFLRMISVAETGKSRVNAGTNYNVFYGGSTFSNLSDHPVITGEKAGVRLPDSWCRKAGLNPGCVSTAAGAYQIIRPTWENVRRAGTWGPALTDFSPASQDEAARRILSRIGALAAIESNDFDQAVWLASTQWASLPGSYAGQPTISGETATAIYNEGLSIFS